MRGSNDFKRSANPGDYSAKWTGGGNHSSRAEVVPASDFWIRLDSGGYYWTTKVRVGRTWRDFDATFKLSSRDAVRSYVIKIGAPCGRGALYVRNVAVGP